MIISETKDKTPDQIKEWYRLFHSFYKLKGDIYFKNFNSIDFGNRKNRKCRFCGKDKMETSFKNKAHIIPHFLGNQYFKSFYECDACNSKFSKYENDLSSFIGLIRYFHHQNKSEPQRERKFMIRNKNFKVFSSEIGIEIHDIDNELIEDIEKDRILKTKINKNPYIPLNVYKCFIKMFLSLITDESMQAFEKTKEFLLTNIHNNSEVIKNFANLKYFWLTDFYTDYPYFQIFELRDYSKNNNLLDNTFFPRIVFILYYKFFLYQIHIPFDAYDQYILDKKKFKLHYFYYPPIVYYKSSNEIIGYPVYTHYVENLFKNEKIFNVKDEFYIEYLAEPIKIESSDNDYKEIIKKKFFSGYESPLS